MPFFADRKMDKDPDCQSPGPKITHGLRITAGNPSSIPLQTSFSAENLEIEYPLTSGHGAQSVSSVVKPFGFEPIAAVELT